MCVCVCVCVCFHISVVNGGWERHAERPGGRWDTVSTINRNSPSSKYLLYFPFYSLPFISAERSIGGKYWEGDNKYALNPSPEATKHHQTASGKLHAHFHLLWKHHWRKSFSANWHISSSFSLIFALSVAWHNWYPTDHLLVRWVIFVGIFPCIGRATFTVSPTANSLWTSTHTPWTIRQF